jgi:hypothetical protein
MPMKEFSTAILWILVFLRGPTVNADSGPPVLSPPALSGVDAAYLVDLAERAAVASALEQDPQQTAYIPSTLKDVQAGVAVTLRHRGYQRARAYSQPGPLVTACVQAGRLAGDALTAEDRERLSHPDAFTTEIEIFSVPQRIPDGLNDLDRLKQAVILGRDGLGMRYQGREALLFPSEFLAQGWSLEIGVRQLLKRMDLLFRDQKQYAGNLTFYTFQTAHFVEGEDGKPPWPLHRGVRVLPEEGVTREALDAAIHALGRYLLYRQNPQGVFAYEYAPAGDAYAAKDDWEHQTLTGWAISRYAKLSERAEVAQAADQAANAFAQLLGGRNPRPEIRYISTPGGDERLSLSALYLLLLMDHHQNKDHQLVMKQLIAAIFSQQRPDGRIFELFPPSSLDPTKTGDAGQGLYALARGAMEFDAPGLKKAVENSLPYYANEFETAPLARMVPWYSMAYALAAKWTGRRQYADLVFTMTDNLASRQLTPESLAPAELIGGIALTVPESADARTGEYLMGFSAAVRLARILDDEPRARRYELLVRRAARFVMQLQFREEECFYVRSFQDTVGGIRRSLSNHTLRIDQSAAGLLGLLDAMEVLYPESPGK